MPLSSKWSWFFGFLTAASLVFGVIFFVATQQLTGRDWIVLLIGLVSGALTTALIATFIAHRPTPVSMSAESGKAPSTESKSARTGRASISMPGQVTHGRLHTSLNLRTRVHSVYWNSTRSPAGELRPGRGESFDVIDDEGRHRGQVKSIRAGMELIEKSFSE